MKRKEQSVLWMGVLLSTLWVAGIQAENVTNLGNPFMTVSPNTADSAFFASGGSNSVFDEMTDGNNGTTHDTWQGDIGTVYTWLYDAMGMQFPSGISGIARLEWDLQVFGDGGWFNTIDEPLVVQVTTNPAFGSYTLAQDSYPGSDGIWVTVPYWHNYPPEVSGNGSGDPGVPADSSKFGFDIDFPGTIYGVRIIGDGGGSAGADPTGFAAVEELRVFTGDNKTRATAISPAQHATGIVVAGAMLKWNPAQKDGAIDPNVVGHFVYLGADPNGILVSGDTAIPKTTTSFPVTLAKDTVYYWHVDELMGDGKIHGGYVYTFQTELTLPVINSQPRDLVIAEGKNAVFAVDADDPLGGILSYHWYYDTDGFAGGETALVDGVDYGGTATNTLTIVSADSADEGYYFCTLDNGLVISTNWVRLSIGNLIGHWKMDGDPNDATGNSTGVSSGDPIYGAGKIGQAIRMDGIDDYVQMSGDFADFSTGLTLSVWAKPTSIANWGRFFDFANGSASDNILFARGGTSNQLVMEIYNGATGGAVWSPAVIEVDTWQMFTTTVDPKGNVVLYKNGVAVGTGMTNIPNVLSRNLCFIGRSNWPEWDSLYAGWMDDLRLYNYALTAEEVADVYLEPEDIDYACVQPVAFDLDGDCRIDLGDFAILAERWLNCGRYPACIPSIP